MASGFRIIKEQLQTVVPPGRILLVGATGLYSTVTDSSGIAVFNTTAVHALKIGDIVQINGTEYDDFNAVIASIPSTTSFTTALPFSQTDTGTYSVNDFITFNDFVPTDFMQEVQVQLSVSTADMTGTLLSITLDGGDSYIFLNDNEKINGLTTFTFFVKQNSAVNFLVPSAATITMIVGVS